MMRVLGISIDLNLASRKSENRPQSLRTASIVWRSIHRHEKNTFHIWGSLSKHMSFQLPFFSSRKKVQLMFLLIQ